MSTDREYRAMLGQLAHDLNNLAGYQGPDCIAKSARALGDIASGKARHYYEAHITIDPVFDTRRELAGAIAAVQGYRLAELIMRKQEADVEHPAQDDTFLTSRSGDLEDLRKRTIKCVIVLQLNDFTVRRYKIEDTLLDSRESDEFGILTKPGDVSALLKVTRRTLLPEVDEEVLRTARAVMHQDGLLEYEQLKSRIAPTAARVFTHAMNFFPTDLEGQKTLDGKTPESEDGTRHEHNKQEPQP